MECERSATGHETVQIYQARTRTQNCTYTSGTGPFLVPSPLECVLFNGDDQENRPLIVFNSPRRFSCAINSTKLLITIYFKKSCNGNRFALLCRLVLGEIRRHFGRSFAYRDNNRERYSFSPPGRSKSSAPVKFSGVITTAQRKYIICIFNIMFLFAFYMIDMSVKVCNFRISRSPN